MNANRPVDQNPQARVLERGIRFDLVIAVCALLISSLATGASWWQARVLEAQTKVLQEQLGAQVWPYVSVSYSLSANTVQVSIANDGLGPAVIRSATVTVDGRVKRTFIDVVHAILGPNLIARSPHGENIGLTLNSIAAGSVLRAGDSSTAFGLRSKRYAKPLALGLSRLAIRICYCAVIPGKCWLSDSGSSRDPRPMTVCREIANDLLHQPTVQLINRSF